MTNDIISEVLGKLRKPSDNPAAAIAIGSTSLETPEPFTCSLEMCLPKHFVPDYNQPGSSLAGPQESYGDFTMPGLRLIVIMIAIGMLPAAAGAFGLISESESFMAESAMLSAGKVAVKVRQINEVPSVGVVSLKVPYSYRGTSYSEYRIFASKQAAGISRLQSALSANPATRRALQSRGITIKHIVGVRVSSNGSLRVYVFD